MFTLSMLAAIGLATAPAGAAVIATFTHDYGLGQHMPQGGETLEAGSVRIRQTRTHGANDFLDSFDLSSLSWANITSLALTIDFSRAGPSSNEWWYLDLGNVRPDRTGGSSADLLRTSDGTLTRVIDAASTGTDATVFANALRDLSIDFSFDSMGRGERGFNLASASLSVSGVSVVPLPGPFSLLLSGLGALALTRRRQT
jgi:hypothetical protein